VVLWCCGGFPSQRLFTMMQLKWRSHWTMAAFVVVCVLLSVPSDALGASSAPMRPVVLSSEQPLDMLKRILLTPPVIPVLFKADHPVDVVKRLPVAVLDAGVTALSAFFSTAAVMIPAGLIWKFSALRSNGAKAWGLEALKMGVEWGSFSASYSGGEQFFARIRGLDDKINSYIACGICSAISRVKEGYPAMTQGFVTGFAFVYVLEQLTESMAKKAAEAEGAAPPTTGRQALEGAVASKGTSAGLAGRSSSARVPIRARKGATGRYYGLSKGLYKPL
jgi:hypothetical protein